MNVHLPISPGDFENERNVETRRRGVHADHHTNELESREDGLVCSNAEVEAESARRDRAEKAMTAKAKRGSISEKGVRKPEVSKKRFGSIFPQTSKGSPAICR